MPAAARARPIWRGGRSGHSSGVGAASSLASRSRCDVRPANAAQPWTGPPAAVPTAAAATVASSVWLRGRVRRLSIALGRAERAATA